MRAIKSKWLLVCGLVLLFGLTPQVRGGTSVWTVLDPYYVPQSDPGFAEVLPGEDMDGHVITWGPVPHPGGGVRFWSSWNWDAPVAGDTLCWLYDDLSAIVWWRGTFNNPSTKIQIQLKGCDNNDGWADIYVDGVLEFSYNSLHAVGTDVTIIGQGLSNIPHTVSIQTRIDGGDVSLDYVAIPVETGPFPKWEQPPKKADPNNIFYGWNEPSIHNSDWQIAADDWFCDTNLPVTHVVWWGSFLGWKSPDADWLMPKSFHIAIWKDVQANPPDEPWSHPGTVIYEADVDTYTWDWVGWDYDPRAFELGDPPFETCFRFKTKLPTPFYQDPSQDNIYWISIAADYTGGQMPEYVWGWKTRPRNPDSLAPDDAVRIFNPTSALFGEDYVDGEPIEWPDGKSWDLAFKLVYQEDDVLKWRQDPNENLPGLHAHDYEDTAGSYHSITLADQWICSGGEVHDLHWFGNYETDALGNEIRGAGINTFHLSIHKDDPAVQLPIDPEDWGIDVPFAWVSETDTGLVNLEGCKIYEYTYILTDPYLQEQGQVYWLDIMAKANDPADHPVWRWQEARRGSLPIVAPAAQKSDGGPWTHISWSGDPRRYSDMAFWVSSQAGGDPVVKWLQPPATFDPDNAYYGWDEYSVYNSDIQIVADDWYCDSDAPVTDVHWWGSFLGYDDPNVPYNELPQSFHIGIWDDVPAGGGAQPWSRPGDMLWQHKCYDYTIKFVGWDIDPRYEDVPPEATFYFECYLPEDEWFYQDTGDNIYWVSIAADYSNLPGPPQNPFGMKTRPRDPDSRAPDDAVRIFDPTNPVAGSAFNLGEPIEWPLGKSWDLAFVLTTHEELELDWGDAPVIVGALGYPTLFANNGARHEIGGPWLGVATDFPDAEPDGQPNIPATGDNNDIDPLNPGPNHDDENGVTFPAALYVNQTVTINVEVNGGGGFVDGWIDFNSDTVWQASEQIHNAPLPDGTNPVSFTVPGTAVVGDTYARFRISSAGGLSPEGLASDGEVEDYRIYIREAPTDLDWGDAWDGVTFVGYPTLAAHNGANHTIVANGPWLGDITDGPDDEPDGQPDLWAMGDDLDTGAGNPLPNYDDEDGVFIPPLIQGHTVYITIEVNGGGGGGVVQGWIDYDGDMVWDLSEAIPALGGYFTNGIHFIPVTAPLGAVNYATYARFRISSAGGLPPDGPASDGEVEDYVVFINEPPDNMKWAQWPDTTPNGIDIRVDRGRTIADDFLCTFPSLLTDVHFWGSWKDDYQGQILNIHLSIHSDDPVGPGGTDPDNTYSKPDVLLWEDDFNPFEFEESVYVNLFNPEWWWDPATGELIADGDKTIYKYDIQINSASAFLQNGTPENPVIYWLDIRVDTEDLQNTEFGWKTRQYPDHFMDDAVFDRGTAALNWKELRYPPGHPYHELDPNSIDMSFVLTFEELSSDPFDFGDAPDSFLPTIPPYPTQLPDGARHTVVPGVYLGGSIVDVELDGQQSPDALGDDNYDGYDDEDGVTFLTVPLVPGGWGELEVTASVDGFLYGWIDFNEDGSWADVGDQIFNGKEVDGGMVTPLTFKVPMTAKPNNTTFARFRYITTAMDLSYDGQASDGEVEDYTVLIGNRCGIKWVQTPDETEFGIDIRVDDGDGNSRILADDFECTSVDRITRVYLWGSWNHDIKGEIKNIHLSFHSDNPSGPGGYSIPDVLLWEGDFEPNDILESLYTTTEPNEYWWDPVTGTLIPLADSQIWLVQVNINPEEAFLQKGSKDNPVIYWLDVQVKTEGGEFGWKTRTFPWFHFQDDAVWGLSTAPGIWTEMLYPPGHPHSAGLGSIDMAFMLTTDEYCPGSADLNCDGVVNLLDWSIFTNQWLFGIWP